VDGTCNPPAPGAAADNLATSQLSNDVDSMIARLITIHTNNNISRSLILWKQHPELSLPQLAGGLLPDSYGDATRVQLVSLSWVKIIRPSR